MASLVGRDDLIVPDESDSELAKVASRSLARARDQQVNVKLDDGTELALPKSVTELLVRMLTELSNGNMVSIVPVHAELTTQEAANLLNVSRPHLVKLLVEQAIPFHMAGAHRRIRFADLNAYMLERETQRENAMQALAKDAQDLDLGY